MKKVILASLLGIAVGAVANAQASGTLTINGTINGTMTLAITQDASGAVLGGSSTAATMNFGTVSAATTDGPLGNGITKTTAGGNYTLATFVNVTVTAANGTSPNYALAAAIDNTDNYTWQVGTMTMSTSPTVLIDTALYSTVTPVPIALIVPIAAPPTASVSRVVTFTATAN